MRRVYLRGRENILKRQLIHVGAFNLSLIFRQTLGAGTPRQFRNRLIRLILVICWFSRALKANPVVSRHTSRFPKHRCQFSYINRLAEIVTSTQRGTS
jgi:hypothetical protein